MTPLDHWIKPLTKVKVENSDVKQELLKDMSAILDGWPEMIDPVTQLIQIMLNQHPPPIIRAMHIIMPDASYELSLEISQLPRLDQMIVSSTRTSLIALVVLDRLHLTAPVLHSLADSELFSSLPFPVPLLGYCLPPLLS